MLHKIIFVIKNEQQIEQINKMKNNFKNDNVTITIYMASEMYLCRSAASYCSNDIGNREDTLFVTDEERVLKELKEEGDYVIALLHDENRMQDLSGASYAITDIGDLKFDSFQLVYMRLAGEPWTILETKRCIVRETTVEDVDAFYEIYKEPSITEYMENLFEDPEEERAYTNEYIKKVYGFYGYGLWTVVCKENGNVIGRAGISWREGFDIPEIGFVFGVPYQHQGYALEVCKAILKYGKEELHFEQIQALVKEGNEASFKLCRKLGFKWEEHVESRGKQYERLVIRNHI